MAITLTETALHEVKRVIGAQAQSGMGLRVGVKGGGCSGLSYSMNLDEKHGPADQVFEFDGVKIFCDPKSYLYVNGLTLDFSTDLMNGGFKFINPNATKTCGCGTSFSA
ncbi:iron-sulfur cluster assembly accessory protein [candidate division BRC1 bacterium HGW-BRC1-1]|jgi:iron-sulfur cluster assembly protein|nr:MAG: iron-sulfur cluster assembly accessory protein [candidate division BRC1 bacterium HGW-BRC1-1]